MQVRKSQWLRLFVTIWKMVSYVYSRFWRRGEDIKSRGKEKEGRKEVYVVSISMHI